MGVLVGGCHCGRIRVRFSTTHTGQTLPLRACQCSFCRRHDARTASGPEDRLEVTADGAVTAYRFDARTADFLICPVCGIYVAAVMATPKGLVATVNTRVFDDPVLAARPAEPVAYDGESPEARRARRAARWCPVQLDVRLARSLAGA